MGYMYTQSCSKIHHPERNIVFTTRTSKFARPRTFMKREDALTTPEYWFGTGSSDSGGSIIAMIPPEHLAVNKFSYEHGYAPMLLSVIEFNSNRLRESRQIATPLYLRRCMALAFPTLSLARYCPIRRRSCPRRSSCWASHTARIHTRHL